MAAKPLKRAVGVAKSGGAFRTSFHNQCRKMFITGQTYDLSKDYNMMLGKNLIDCFEEVPVPQETLAHLMASIDAAAKVATEPAAAAAAESHGGFTHGSEKPVSSTQSRPPASVECF